MTRTQREKITLWKEPFFALAPKLLRATKVFKVAYLFYLPPGVTKILEAPGSTMNFPSNVLHFGGRDV